tara:strand:- start:41 stop:433 length:393 start_codon:yes stop_codon:yes gene_type:complete
MSNKPKKKVFVLFAEGKQPRVYVNPSNMEELTKRGKVIANPDMKRLKGTSPSDWKLRGDKILVSAKDLEVESELINPNGLPEIKKIKIEHEYIVIENKPDILLPCVASAIIGILSSYLVIVGILLYLGAK